MREKKEIENFNFYLKIDSESSPLDTLTLGLFIPISIFIESIIIVGLFGTPSRIENLWYIVLFIFLAMVWSIDQFLWQIIGKEIVIINDKLEIHKAGKLFTSKTFIRIEEINSIEFSVDDQTMKFEEKYFFKGGIIKVQTHKKDIRFGKSLTREKAIEVARAMTSVIEEIECHTAEIGK